MFIREDRHCETGELFLSFFLFFSLSRSLNYRPPPPTLAQPDTLTHTLAHRILPMPLPHSHGCQGAHHTDPPLIRAQRQPTGSAQPGSVHSWWLGTQLTFRLWCLLLVPTQRVVLYTYIIWGLYGI